MDMNGSIPRVSYQGVAWFNVVWRGRVARCLAWQGKVKDLKEKMDMNGSIPGVSYETTFYSKVA